MTNGFCCGLRLALLATVACLSVVCWAAEPDSDAVLFNRDIRPILSDHCYTCHGPDKANRKTNMHFDTEEGACSALNSGGFAIVRGDPANSEMCSGSVRMIQRSACRPLTWVMRSCLPAIST